MELLNSGNCTLVTADHVILHTFIHFITIVYNILRQNNHAITIDLMGIILM